MNGGVLNGLSDAVLGNRLVVGALMTALASVHDSLAQEIEDDGPLELGKTCVLTTLKELCGTQQVQ